VSQYPSHVVSALSEPTGYEAHRFSAGRRDQYSTASTANLDWWHKTIFNRVRALDCVCLWIHNLQGKAYQLQVSDDDFTTYQTPINITIPTSPAAGDIDDANGVLCENGMWIMRFPLRTGIAYRHFIVAGGAGFKPQIAGKVGLSLALNQFDKPFAPSDTELIVTEEMGESGWIGRGPRRLKRFGSIQVKTRAAFEYDQFRYHFEQRFGGGCPMLIVFDDSQAERAVMAQRGPGRFGFKVAPISEWPDDLRVGEFSWQELDPSEIA